MFHNGNTGGAGMDSLFCSYIGLNPAQLLDLMVMGMENQGIARRILRYGEAWYYTEDISRVGHSPEGIYINIAKNVISANW